MANPPPSQPTLSTSPDQSLPLVTLSASGTPPKARLSNATMASDIFWNLHDAAQPRLARAAIIRGMFDGNPPYNPTKMRNSARAWEPNFNTLEAASRLEAAKVPYYDLFSTAPLYASCDTDVEGPVDATAASRVRSDAFDTMLRSYDGFDIQFWTMLDDFVAFNKGFLWWPRPDSWHFKRLPWHRVLFPQGTSSDPDEWELFAIEHRWPAHKLWGFIADEKASTVAGWNRAQVIDAIRRAAPEDIGREWNDPMQVQKAFRDCDFWQSARIGVVRSASIYVREFNGTWSRMMIQVEDRRNAERNDSGAAREAQSRMERVTKQQQGRADAKSTDLRSTEQQQASKAWLYFKQNIADSLYQIMCPFIFEAGEGSMNELSGLGKRIVSFSQTVDRLANETARSAMMRSTLVLQAQTGATQAKAAIVQLGGGTCVIPPGYTPQPGTLFGDLQGPMAVSQDFRNRLDANTGIYRPQFEKPSGNPESAAAANIRFSQATVLTNSAVNRFYSQLDRFYTECFRRATLPTLPRTSKDKGVQAALEYQEECKDAGLTKEQCYDREAGAIRSQRAIGNGSPVMRQQSMGALSNLVPFMGPRGLLAWKQDYAAAYTGQRGSTRYFPLADTAQVPTRDDWDANQENADMNQGNPPVFADWQNMTIHANVHLSAAFQAVKAVLQDKADPAIPFTFLQVALPHIVQHISKVPVEQVRKELEAAYKQVAQGAQQVAQAAKQHLDQQGQQQNLTLDQQLKVMTTQHEISIKEAKAKAQMEQRAQKAQFDEQLAVQQQQSTTALAAQKQQADVAIAAAKQQAEHALADATTAHTITTTTAKTLADIKALEAKTAADIEAQRAKAAAAAATPKKGSD